MLTKLKFSTHVRFVVGALVIAFVGALATQPAIISWLALHPIIAAFVTSAGVAFHAYNTYAGTTEPVTPGK